MHKAFRVRACSVSLSVALILLAAGLVSAQTIINTGSSVLNTANSNITDLGNAPGPYGSLTVTLVDATHANLTFTAGSDANYNYYFTSQGAVGVNVNATSWVVSNLMGTPSPVNTQGVQLSNAGAGNEDGFGSFNQTIDEFDSFTWSLSSISFTLQNTSGTWASADAVLTPNALLNGFEDAAHIGACPKTGCTGFSSTGYAAETGLVTVVTTSSVPEPTSIVLLGSVVLFAANRFRKRRPA